MRRLCFLAVVGGGGSTVGAANVRAGLGAGVGLAGVAVGAGVGGTTVSEDLLDFGR